jgi:hypothetical protein
MQDGTCKAHTSTLQGIEEGQSSTCPPYLGTDIDGPQALREARYSDKLPGTRSPTSYDKLHCCERSYGEL